MWKYEKKLQYPVKINNVTTSQLISAAETLEAYAFVDKIPPLKSLVTDFAKINDNIIVTTTIVAI